MTIELFKGEDNLLLAILTDAYCDPKWNEGDADSRIYRLIERITLTQKLYENMYGRKTNERKEID